jgi:hypothetical protein
VLTFLKDRIVGQEQLAMYMYQPVALVVGRAVLEMHTVCLSLGKPE